MNEEACEICKKKGLSSLMKIKYWWSKAVNNTRARAETTYKPFQKPWQRQLFRRLVVLLIERRNISCCNTVEIN